MTLSTEERLAGALLGCAVGDSLGLPREGLAPNRAAKLFGALPLRHRFFCGRGMISDDTEHACMVLQALRDGRGDVHRFSRSLAWRLRGWLLCLPAGIGWATLRSIIKLWLGFPLSRSGVASAGNGPAMRSPVIGVYFAHDAPAREAHVLASTRLTHRHPLAEDGALLIAHAAAGLTTLPALCNVARTPEFRASLARLEEPLSRGLTVMEVAAASGLGHGVSGFILHTVPIALYACLRHRHDFPRAIEETVACGGDTDTTAAIVGAVMGATLGVAAIPPQWLDGIWEWPRSTAWLKRLATADRPLSLFWPGLLFRSAFQMAVVLAHGFRRLAPPY